MIDHSDFVPGVARSIRFRGEMFVDTEGAKRIGRNKQQHSHILAAVHAIPNRFPRVAVRSSRP
ncbi:hypothetical protein [Nocardia sp. CY41]|uniref:hypothetical protein n=1 Tax=Nocardia sp. CY41 TaxID=2608686 RepID=UPI001F2F2000|nr:hypothetical protein [Nocardia sp. CY41]